MSKKVWKITIRMAVAMALGSTGVTANAALASDARLSFSAGIQDCALGGVYPSGCTYGVTTLVSGSWFALDSNGTGAFEGFEKIPISQFAPLKLGVVQSASGSHSGGPNGSESPAIDNPWAFKAQTGMHGTSSPISIIGDDGAGNVTLDFSGWFMTWSSIVNIPLGGDSASFPGETGLAALNCAVDCSVGDTYVLDYAAHVPLDSPSGFGGVFYGLRLEGVVSAVPVPAAAFLFVSGLVGLAGGLNITRRNNRRGG